jgi:hypothetical protein
VESEGVEPSRRGVQGRPVTVTRSREKHECDTTRVGRPGIEPGSPRLQRAPCTVSATAPRRFREQGSIPHLRVQSAAACLVLADPGMALGAAARRKSCRIAPFPRSRRYRCPGGFSRSGSRTPTVASNETAAPHASRHCASPPQRRRGYPDKPCEDSNLTSPTREG